MRFHDFFRCLTEKRPTPRVEVSSLAKIVNLHHFGVGTLTFKYFPDFDGAQFGNFIWLDEERTSPYEDPYNNAVVFINSRFQDDIPMRRIIAAKELMHVFDSPDQKADNPAKFKTLLDEIASSPIPEDQSERYAADRGALWKAILSLVPPWIRDEHRQSGSDQPHKAAELAALLWLPENVVAAAMGDYYDKAAAHFLK
jgi:hypothetical protein